MAANLASACWSFTASADPRANAARIRAGIAAAAEAGTRLLLTPECALPGYPSAARADVIGLDDCLIGELEGELAFAANQSGIALVLGTASRHGNGWSNDALVCGAVESARYRKRCLTPIDRAHFLAGGTPTVVTIDDWRVGIAICFDVRFSDVFLGLAATGADAFAMIAHMAGPDPDPGTKAMVIPALCAARAAEYATPLVLCNTAADDRYLDSGAWDARGMRVASNVEGLLRCDLRRREDFDPWYDGLRREALGRWRR